MAGDNVEEEYMWSCLLDKECKEFHWMPDEPTNGPYENKNEEENEDLKPGHKLLIKNAILMPEAAEDDVNVVQIECEGYNKTKVVTPLVVMKGQVDYQSYVEILVPFSAKIKLLSGNGPVYLNGSHCVDYTVEEEYMWSCLLDKECKEFQWMPDEPTNGPSENKNEEENEDLKPGHRLLIKNAILMPEAAKDDVNVVQIECEGYNKTKVVTPLVVMKGQVDYQKYVDILVPSSAKIKLLSGDGPVYLNGSHCVDYDGSRGQGENYAEVSEDEEVEMEENGDKKEALQTDDFNKKVEKIFKCIKIEREKEKRKEKKNKCFCLAKDIQNHKDFDNVDDILKFIGEEDSNTKTSKKNKDQVESSKRRKRKNKGIKIPTPNVESDKKVDTVDKEADIKESEKEVKSVTDSKRDYLQDEVQRCKGDEQSETKDVKKNGEKRKSFAITEIGNLKSNLAIIESHAETKEEELEKMACLMSNLAIMESEDEIKKEELEEMECQIGKLKKKLAVLESEADAKEDQLEDRMPVSNGQKYLLQEKHECQNVVTLNEQEIEAPVKRGQEKLALFVKLEPIQEEGVANHVMTKDRIYNQNKDIDSLVELIGGKQLGAIPKNKKEKIPKSKKKKNRVTYEGFSTDSEDFKKREASLSDDTMMADELKTTEEKLKNFMSEEFPIYNEDFKSDDNKMTDEPKKTTEALNITKAQLKETKNQLREEQSENFRLNKENDLLKSKLLHNDFKKYQDVLRQRQKNSLRLIDHLRASPELENSPEVQLALRSLHEFSARLLLADQELGSQYDILRQQPQTNETIPELHFDMSNVEPPDLGSSCINLLCRSILMNQSSTAPLPPPLTSPSSTSSPLGYSSPNSHSPNRPQSSRVAGTNSSAMPSVGSQGTSPGFSRSLLPSGSVVSFPSHGHAVTSGGTAEATHMKIKPRPDQIRKCASSKLASKITNKKVVSFLEMGGDGASINTEDECSICFEEMRLSDSFYLKLCRHRFHVTCMKLWLVSHRGMSPTCPMCRTYIVKEDEFFNLGAIK